MDGRVDDNPGDIQAQVLQTTLDVIEISLQDPTEPRDGDGDHDGDCCVICLDSISGPCVALPCGHAHFDFLCLASWLQQQPNCPLCKANVYKVRYADVQKGDEAFYSVPNAAQPRDATGGDDLNRPSRTRFTSQNGLLRETNRRIPRPPPSPNEAIRHRRHIYRHELYSLHIGSNRISQYRAPPTPIQFSSTPHLLSRARLWIRRELQVFSFLSDDPDDPTITTPQPTTTTTPQTNRRRNNAAFLLEYTLAILKTVDLQDSAGQAATLLSDFLGEAHARLFLHELRCWLRSPAASLAAWDREVRYPDVGRVVGRGEEDGGGDNVRRGGGRGGGVSWRDRGGDHWRAGGERGKRKGRGEEEEEGEAGEGRVSRPRRE